MRVFGSTKAVPYSQQSYPDYRARSTTLGGLVAYGTGVAAISSSRDEVPQLLGTWFVSENFFSALDIEPNLGRGFREDEGRVGASPVVVIAHTLWERRFHSDPSAVGAGLTLGTREFTIIGVAPDGFSGTELYFHPDLYVPLTMPERSMACFETSWTIAGTDG